MLNLVKSIKLIPLFLFIVFASTATATDAFEEYGSKMIYWNMILVVATILTQFHR